MHLVACLVLSVQKEVSDTLELESQTVLSHHMDAGNQTRALTIAASQPGLVAHAFILAPLWRPRPASFTFGVPGSQSHRVRPCLKTKQKRAPSTVNGRAIVPDSYFFYFVGGVLPACMSVHKGFVVVVITVVVLGMGVLF